MHRLRRAILQRKNTKRKIAAVESTHYFHAHILVEINAEEVGAWNPNDVG